MKARFFLVLSVSVGSVTAACGGASEGDLFAGSSATDAGSTPRDATPPSTVPLPDANAPDDASTKPDSGGEWKSPGIFCGVDEKRTSVYCPVDGQLCCATLDRTLSFQFACEPATTNACPAGRPLRCDDRTDCPTNQVCCATFEEGFGYRSAECRSVCKGGAVTVVRLCDAAAPVDECREIGKKCRPSESLKSFGFCDK